MWTYLIGPLLAVLPAQWRKDHLGRLAVDWARAAAVSSFMEGFAAAIALVVWYSVFVTHIGNIIGGAGDGLGGYAGLFSFAMHPLTWVIGYFGCEGAVRFLAAVTTGEAYGIAPLALISWSVQQLKPSRHSKAVPDEVHFATSGYDLKIASSRPKDHWKYPLTIRYQGHFFQVIGEEHASPSSARPHAYLLRRLPANETIKGLEVYDPASMPTETLGFFENLLSQIRRATK